MLVPQPEVPDRNAIDGLAIGDRLILTQGHVGKVLIVLCAGGTCHRGVLLSCQRGSAPTNR